MKFKIAILTAIMLTTTPALASSDMETAAGTSVLVLLFLGFGALVVACQLVPSLMLFCSMLKGLFNNAAHESLPKTGAKTS